MRQERQRELEKLASTLPSEIERGSRIQGGLVVKKSLLTRIRQKLRKVFGE